MNEPLAVGEHEMEPVLGLPELPPEGEEILWQGSPEWRSLARRAFHTRKVAVYFAALVAWRVVSGVADAEPLRQAAVSTATLVALALAALGILGLLGWLNARATIYTITSRRVVIRFGVAFVVSLNLPFRTIQGAELRQHADGTGDIPLRVEGADRFGWFMLWPFARPWRFGQNVEPMLRAVPEAARVAEILVNALETPAQRTAVRVASTGLVSTDAPRAVAAAG